MYRLYRKNDNLWSFFLYNLYIFGINMVAWLKQFLLWMHILHSHIIIIIFGMKTYHLYMQNCVPHALVKIFIFFVCKKMSPTET